MKIKSIESETNKVQGGRRRGLRLSRVATVSKKRNLFFKKSEPNKSKK